MRTRLNGSKMSPFLSLRGRAPSPVIARRLLRPTKQSQDSLGTGSAISNNEIPRSNRPRNDILGVFSNEKGIALVMVLILSAIALAIMSGLVYMVISGTQISGIQKRYKTALEAGIGGADVTYQVIKLRGDATSTAAFLLVLQNGATTTPSSCTFTCTCQNIVSGKGKCAGTEIECTSTTIIGLSLPSLTLTSIEAKLKTPTTSWSGCDSSLTINTASLTSYDFRFDLGTSPNQYRVYSKIVDTVEGNSSAGVDTELIKTGVVVSNPGEVPVKSIPYLYTIEIDAQNFSNPAERAKLSVLYQY